jgi:hypothetical protein
MAQIPNNSSSPNQNNTAKQTSIPTGQAPDVRYDPGTSSGLKILDQERQVDMAVPEFTAPGDGSDWPVAAGLLARSLGEVRDGPGRFVVDPGGGLVPEHDVTTGGRRHATRHSATGACYAARDPSGGLCGVEFRAPGRGQRRGDGR